MSEHEGTVGVQGTVNQGDVNAQSHREIRGPAHRTEGL